MGVQAGFNPTKTYTTTEYSSGIAGWKPGVEVEAHDGKRYVFLKSTANITQYDVVCYDETYIAVVAPVSTSNDAAGDKICVAPVAVTSGDYFWGQVWGPCTLNALASDVANARQNTTATAGNVDDDGTAGSFAIEGLILTANRGGSAPTAGWLHYPYQRYPVL